MATNQVQRKGLTVLFATATTSTKALSWADLVRSGPEALALWKERRHAYVFADFGDLGGGLTGARLAAQIRKECQETVIILLADEVQPHHLAWAQRNGATDVVDRSTKSITSCLPSSSGRPMDFPSGFPSDESPAAVKQVVDSRLQRYGRMGPARTIVLEDAFRALVKEKGTTPTAIELAKRVSVDIPKQADREAFIRSFEIQGK